MRAYIGRHCEDGGGCGYAVGRTALWCGRVNGGAYTADWAPTASESKHRRLKPGWSPLKPCYRPLNREVAWEPGAWSKSVWTGR